MRKTMKKTIALLLTVVMLLSLSIPMVGAVEAEEANVTTYPSYNDARDGELIYEVDFTKENFAALNNTSGSATKSADALTLLDTTVTTFTYGGALSNLELDAGQVYTIDIAVSGNTDSKFIYLAPGSSETAIEGTYGIQFTNKKMKTTAPNNISFVSNLTIYESSGNSLYNQKIRFVVSSTTNKFAIYYKNTSGAWVNFKTDVPFADTLDCLHLYFGNYSQSVAATFSDINIYKGDLGTSDYEVENYGEKVFDVNFGDNEHPNWTQIGDVSGTTTVYDEGKTLCIDGDAEYTVGDATIADLPLDEYAVYTVFFNTAFSEGNSSAHFLYLDGTDLVTNIHLNQMKFEKPAGTWAKNITPKTEAVTRGEVEYQEISVKIVLDMVKKSAKLYYLNTSDKWTLADSVSYAPTSRDLILNFKEYSGYSALLSNVEVYSTSNLVTIIDGEEQKTVTIPDEAEYILPSAAPRAGYMFKGYKVNGAEAITKVGEKVATDELETLEKVFVPVMSEIWWQAAKIYDGETDTGKRDVRFVSAIDSLKYSAIGYDVTITYGGNSYDNNNFDLKHVYGSLLASYGAEVVTLETLEYDDTNGGYITAFVIKNVPNNVGDIKVELTPYQVTPDGTKVTGDVITVTLTADGLNK